MSVKVFLRSSEVQSGTLVILTVYVVLWRVEDGISKKANTNQYESNGALCIFIHKKNKRCRASIISVQLQYENSFSRFRLS